MKDEEHTSPKNTLVFDVSINIEACERGYPFRTIDHFGTRIYLDIFIVCTPFENQRWLKLTIHGMYVLYTQNLIREKKAKELRGKETRRYKTGQKRQGAKYVMYCMYCTYNSSPNESFS